MSGSLWNQLIVLGKVAVRVTARLAEHAVEQADEIWQESKKAFLQELDPNIEDARIIEERSSRPSESSQDD